MEQKRIFSFLTSGFFCYSIYGFGFDGLFFHVTLDICHRNITNSKPYNYEN